MAERLIQISPWRGGTYQWKVNAVDSNAALEIAAVTQLGFSSVSEASQYTSLTSGPVSEFRTDLLYWDGFLQAVAERTGPVPRHVIVRNDGNVPTTFRIALTARSYNRQGQLKGTTSVVEEWSLGTGSIDAKGAPIYFPTLILVPFGSVLISARLWSINPYRSSPVDEREITLDTNDF